jgi:hypothetical protein
MLYILDNSKKPTETPSGAAVFSEIDNAAKIGYI